MASVSFVLICIAYLMQSVYSQCLGPAGLGYGYEGRGSAMGPGYYGGPVAPLGLAPSLEYASGYGGSGVGDVGVTGELPVAGTTIVAGQVPVMGAVRFAGDLPAAGVVTISGTCACGCGAPGPFYY